MSLTPEKIADLRVKHLDYVEAVVTRLAGQSAALKGQCVTVTTAICGFAATLKMPVIIWIAALPILTFAWLDAKYLNEERLFRALYETVRTGDWASAPTFEMKTDRSKSSVWSTLFSWSVFGFYGPVALVAAALMVALIQTFDCCIW